MRDTPALDPVGSLWTSLSRRARLVLVLLCLALWTPGVLSLPPTDRDESRFAQASKQMLESGDFVDIRFGQTPRYKKPVGIYWLQAAAAAVAGFGERNHIWTYRLPSLIGGLLAVCLTFWCARAFCAPEPALFAASLLATSLLMTVEATLATTDAVLLACIVAAEAVMLRVYLAARGQPSAPPPGLWSVLAGWAAVGVGVLVKGPVVLLVCALTLIGVSLWDREWRWMRALKPLLGVAVLVVITAPWFIAIASVSHGAFFAQSLGKDFGAKLVGGEEAHGAPPGYYLLLSALTFWPAVLVVGPGLVAAITRRTEPAMRFLLAWAGTSWLAFELVPTKLPHYVLPSYPALAILGAVWIYSPATPAVTRVGRLPNDIAAWQYGVGLALFSAALLIVPRLYGGGVIGWLVVLAVLGAALGAGALIQIRRNNRLAGATLAFAAAFVLYPAMLAGAAPLLSQIWVSPRLAALVSAHRQPGDPPVAVAGYQEPSLVFLLGANTVLTDGAGVADAMAKRGGLGLVDQGERPRFLARLAQHDAHAALVDQLGGINYSNGRPVRIGLYRIEGASGAAPPAPTPSAPGPSPAR